MQKAREYDRRKIDLIVRRIIGYYLDSLQDKEIDFLLACLDGGKIPADTANTLRPVLERLVDEESGSRSVPTRKELDALEQLRAEVESLYKEKAATRRTLKSAIHSQKWSKSEQALAARFGIQLLPVCERTLDLLAQEVALSDFTAKEIVATFRNDTISVDEFCGRWYADCHDRDYGEEWDPNEGNQQEGNPPGQPLGIGQGFIVSHTILYLYAARDPDGLVGYFKRRKMAHGKKVARDVLRVYRRTASQSS